MSFREQEYILAIAKYGNLSKAAEFLYVSQPTLSIFLKKIEENIGTPLFIRNGKKLTPTYAGNLYITYAQELIFRQQQFQSELSSILAGTQGKIRIGIHKKRTINLIAYILPKFSKIYPNIEVSILEGDSEDMEQLLLLNQLDLAICNRYFTSNQLSTINIYTDQLLLITPKNHPASKNSVKVLNQTYPYLDLNYLSEENFILQSLEQSTRTFTDRALAYCNVKPKRRIQIENMDAASQLAAEGYGIAFTTKSYATYYTYYKPVDFYLTGDPNDFFNIFIAYNAIVHLPNYTQYFIQLVEEYFKTLP